MHLYLQTLGFFFPQFARPKKKKASFVPELLADYEGFFLVEQGPLQEGGLSSFLVLGEEARARRDHPSTLS